MPTTLRQSIQLRVGLLAGEASTGQRASRKDTRGYQATATMGHEDTGDTENTLERRTTAHRHDHEKLSKTIRNHTSSK